VARADEVIALAGSVARAPARFGRDAQRPGESPRSGLL